MSVEQKRLFRRNQKPLKVCGVSKLVNRFYPVCNLSFVEWGRLGTPRDAKST
jgi:hypothetical protein